MGARVLFRKEVTEILKTYKIYVIPLLFLVFGFASPVITKLLPDILAGLSNMEIVVPEMSWIDAFDQFFKNLNQIGIIAVILMFMGRVAEEKHRGTATMILSKPVSRTAWVIAKFGAAVLLVLLSMIPAYQACCIYKDTFRGRLPWPFHRRPLGICCICYLRYRVYCRCQRGYEDAGGRRRG